jgi:hypothetical protein
MLPFEDLTAFCRETNIDNLPAGSLKKSFTAKNPMTPEAASPA